MIATVVVGVASLVVVARSGPPRTGARCGSAPVLCELGVMLVAAVVIAACR